MFRKDTSKDKEKVVEECYRKIKEQHDKMLEKVKLIRAGLTIIPIPPSTNGHKA